MTMKIILSIMAAITLWAAFLYVVIVALFVHFLPHFFGSELDLKLVIFLMIDIALL